MNDLRARDVMSTGVHHVSPRLGLIDLENELSSQRISGAPVVERNEVVGVVSRSDIARALSRERSKSAAAAAYYFETDASADEGSIDPTDGALQSLRKLTVRDVMTPEVISVAGDHSVVSVAELMRSKRVHRVLVIEGGSLLGIVTSLDIVGAVADLR